MAIPEHILLLNVHFAPHTYGGATVVAEAVARQLTARHGCRVSVISAMYRTDIVPYTVMTAEAEGGIRNYMINLPHHRNYAERYDNPAATEAITGLIDDLAPDLVHVHCIQDIGLGAVTAAKRRGLKVVLSVHDFWWLCEYQFMIRPNGQYCGQYPVQIEDCRGCVDNMARARLRFERLQEVAGQADLVTFPSRFARDLSVASGFREGTARVWENGVTLPGPDFTGKQAARRAADPRLIFGFLGGPSQIKGWPLIRAAFEGMDRDDFAGLLVDGSLKQNWWDDIRISKMRGDWQIHPRFGQEGIDDFYAKIDVLLFPSQWKETFGLTIREAAARGIRIIQTDSGGTAEWPGADPAHMLKIGDGPEALRAEIERALGTPHAHPVPLEVAGYADQADAFARMAGTLPVSVRFDQPGATIPAR